MRVLLGFLLLFLSTPAVFAAPQASGPAASQVIDGPPPPPTPGEMARDADGKSTLRAIKLAEPLRLDGALDEAVYKAAPGFGGMLQIAPRSVSPRPRRPRSG